MRAGNRMRTSFEGPLHTTSAGCLWVEKWKFAIVRRKILFFSCLFPFSTRFLDVFAQMFVTTSRHHISKQLQFVWKLRWRRTDSRVREKNEEYDGEITFTHCFELLVSVLHQNYPPHNVKERESGNRPLHHSNEQRLIIASRMDSERARQLTTLKNRTMHFFSHARRERAGQKCSLINENSSLIGYLQYTRVRRDTHLSPSSLNAKSPSSKSRNRYRCGSLKLSFSSADESGPKSSCGVAPCSFVTVFAAM